MWCRLVWVFGPAVSRSPPYVLSANLGDPPPHLRPQGEKLEIHPPPLLITIDLKRMGRFRLWMRYYVVSYDIPTMI